MRDVTVLLSAYNGEKYIAEQIESILVQKNVNVNIIIRDDGSSDNTLEIIQQYKNRDERIKYFQGNNIGPGKSFFELIKIGGKTDYYAFCDQDDVWDDDKLWCAIQKLEQGDFSKPCLYHSNLRIVDEKLKFVGYAHKKPIKEKSKYSAFAQNVMTGCTAVFNCPAKELILEHIPEMDILHDGWMYLSCKMLGQVFYDFTPHISYRQHKDNVIGMHRSTTKEYLERLKRLFNYERHPRYDRAILFWEQYKDMIDAKDRVKLRKIIDYKKSLFNRLKLFFDLDIREQTRRGDLRYRLLILLGKI